LLRNCDTQHYNIQHNILNNEDTQHNFTHTDMLSFVMLRVTYESLMLSVESYEKNNSYEISRKLADYVSDEQIQKLNSDRMDRGSAITNGREPRSCLGRVFNSKLGRIATLSSKCMVCIQPLLKLKTRPRARPVSQSLSKHLLRSNGYLWIMQQLK